MNLREFDPNIFWFREISKNSIEAVGGKGLNLGEMTHKGFPVPPGFIVTAQAYYRFLKHNKISNQIIDIADSIDVENSKELAKKTKQIREIILTAEMPKEIKYEILSSYRKLGERKLMRITSQEEVYVAVRSSATAEDLPTASFAGQQDTFLNIRGNDSLLKAVKSCWASLFTARATYYRKKQGFPTNKVGIAVVVQKMVQSEASGIMFTSTPTGDTSKIIIEAGFGLGEAVVSGSITPDIYTIDKRTQKVIEKKINRQSFKLIRQGRDNIKVKLTKIQADKQKLPDKHIIDLAKLGKQIETGYQAPQDIEWALEANELYIVQTRAITTLGLTDKKETQQEKEYLKSLQSKIILKGLSASPGIVSGKIRVIKDLSELHTIKEGEILVSKMTSPDWVPAMKKSSAIVTDEGGSTCHAAIVSRELGIPAVVGTSTATIELRTGREVTVDGYNGVIYDGLIKINHEQDSYEIIQTEEIDNLEESISCPKTQQELQPYLQKQAIHMSEEEIQKEKSLLEDFLKRISTKVKVNVALPEAAEKAAETKAEGVGLLRAEHMITASGKHPAYFIKNNQDEELTKVVKEGIEQVAKFFKDKPIYFRTFDARTDEFRELKGGEDEPKEDNPMLGWHGIRRDLSEPRILKAQLRAIKQLYQEGYKNIGVMLPFIIHPSELREAKQIAKEVGIQPHTQIKFGIMIETPASALAIDKFIEEGIDFVSFGTNDLTQLTLGIDRNNEKIQGQFSELHPAILRMLKTVIEECKKNKVVTSICGQAGSNPEMVKNLIDYGIDSVSANIDAVEKIRAFILTETKNQILRKNKKKSLF